MDEVAEWLSKFIVKGGRGHGLNEIQDMVMKKIRPDLQVTFSRTLSLS